MLTRHVLHLDDHIHDWFSPQQKHLVRSEGADQEIGIRISVEVESARQRIPERRQGVGGPFVHVGRLGGRSRG